MLRAFSFEDMLGALSPDPRGIFRKRKGARPEWERLNAV